jgi:hypothetical protein
MVMEKKACCAQGEVHIKFWGQPVTLSWQCFFCHCRGSISWACWADKSLDKKGFAGCLVSWVTFGSRWYLWDVLLTVFCEAGSDFFKRPLMPSLRFHKTNLNAQLLNFLMP